MSDIIKSIAEELTFIAKLSAGANGTVTFRDSMTASGALKKTGIFEVLLTEGGRMNLNVGDEVDFCLSNEEVDILVKGRVRKVSFNSDHKDFFSHRIDVQELTDKNFAESETYYCREIIPIRANKNHFYFNILKDHTYTCDDYKKRGMISVQLYGKTFQVYIEDRNDNYFLIVDCLSPLRADKFSELAWDILISIGYLTGYLPQDEAYCFYYENSFAERFSTYEYGPRRKTLRIIYHPVNDNVYAWLRNSEDPSVYEADKFKPVNTAQLSKLCHWVHEANEIKAILLLILESMSGSLLMMPAGLSVALEGLSEYFYKENSEKFNPIKKEFNQKITKDLMRTLEKYKDSDLVNAYDVLKTKIENINAPTNGDKLMAPFKALNIALSEKEQEVILYRNDFLHGNINLKVPEKTSGKKKYDMDSFEIAVRLYTIISRIILKSVGYDGYIVNHAKTQKVTQRNIDEPTFSLL